MSGVTKQTSRQTLQDLKQSRVNHVLILLSAWIIKVVIKLIQILVLFGNITLTKSGTQRNTKKSRKLGKTWFALLWVSLKHDYKKFQDILVECLKEQSSYEINIKNPKEL